ncbi:ABC transporter ATP-binding protein [Blastococcus haudaquaticus]|uniref:ABC-2 type transport system ATP-binding protein n=1 Tax=Blastococcus haudaquaticus TaxID=1938745 RepID=A0A286GWU3_9ACTN|nr:ABC transporter ATP-binding protein [Blastococcus haudaquaticus]SOE00000.1 ABC-2 type transport system ATP-binding protein [Blastococcus haudaquaticus]
MTTGTNPTATVRDVTMRFREHTALDSVTTSFEKDAITGLLGRNGAGKTTLMQLLTGHRVPSAGRVEVFGASPYENDRILRDICFVKEGQRYPEQFRVQDALAAAAMVFPHWDDDLAADLLTDFDLPAKRPVRKLSRGMNSMVGIIIGLASRAPLTLFDEPYLGLDAVARQQFYDRLLADYAEHPRTIVLSTHLIEEIASLLERVLLIDRGRVLLDTDAESLRDSALTVSGPVDKVQAFARQHELLHTESLGGHSRAVVRVGGAADRRAAATHGLTVEPTNLQQLVVAMSLQSPATRGPVRSPLRAAPSEDLEEVS